MTGKRMAWRLGLFVLAVTLLTASLHIDSGDGEAMYQVGASLASGKGFAIPVSPRTTDSFGPWGNVETVGSFAGGDGYGAWGQGGHYYAKYGLGWSLAVVPFYLVGNLLTTFLPASEAGFVRRAAVMWLNPILTALAAVFFYLLARRLYPDAIAVVLVFLYCFTTIAWYYSKSAFSEPLVTCLLLAAVLAIEERAFWWAGAALGGLLLTRQTTLFLVLPLSVWAGWRLWQDSQQLWNSGHRASALWKQAGKSALIFGLPILLGQLGVFAYNYLRFGSLMDYGYRDVAWGTPLWFGLFSQLLSPGKGLFIFCPVLLVGVAGWLGWNRREWVGLSLGLALCFLLPHAMYSHWNGGGGWGPRLLLPITAVILLPAGDVILQSATNRLLQALLAGLITVSLFIQVMGVSVHWGRHLQRLYDQSANAVDYIFRVEYRWADNPILGQVRSFAEVLRMQRDPQARSVLEGFLDSETHPVNKDQQGDRIGLLAYNVPDFWFVYLIYLGAPPLLILISLISLVLLTAFIGNQIYPDTRKAGLPFSICEAK